MRKKRKSKSSIGVHVNKYDGYSQVEQVRRNADKTNKLISDDGESNLSAIKKDLEPVSRYNKPDKETQEPTEVVEKDTQDNNQLNEVVSTVEPIQPKVEEPKKDVLVREVVKREETKEVKETINKAGMNTLLGMGTVFSVLILIAFIISLFKFINMFTIYII